MNTKKKLLIALLSAACITAGAFSLAACGDNSEGGLQDAYQIYAEAAGDNALSYEDWLSLIKDGNLTSDGLEDAYNAYTQAAGDNALSYDSWLAAIKSDMTDTLQSAYNDYLAATLKADGAALSYEDWQTMIKTYATALGDRTIVSSSVDSDGNFILTYSDNSSETVGKINGDLTLNCGGITSTIIMPKIYTVRAVDQNGNPVANAYLRVGYIKSYSFTEISWGKTDEDGYVYFRLLPSESITYNVRLADPSKIGNIDPTPQDYTLDLGSSNGMAVTDANFTDGRELTFTFKFTANKFPGSSIDRIVYNSAYNDENPDNPKVRYEPLELELKAGYYNYFAFNPYVNPSTVSDSVINPITGKYYTTDEANEFNQSLLDKAAAAATGIYKITIVSDSENIAFYRYNGTTGYMQTDDDGIPVNISAIAGKLPEGADESLYTGTNYITVELDSNYVRGDSIFAVVATENCGVTITVERIGDAYEVPQKQIVSVPIECDPIKWSDDETGNTLTLMPISESLKTFYNEEDGFYHISSVNGPILYMNINNAVERVSGYPINVLNDPEITPFGADTFVFNVEVDDRNNPTKAYDFNNMINTYSALCNSDGVYPVNSDLYLFLQNFGVKCVSASPDSDLNWLLPCCYYVPEDGFPVVGNGTQESPYLLNELNNSVELADGTNYLSFTSSNAGIYAFNISGGALAFGEGVEYVTDGGIYYVTLSKNEQISLTWSEASGKNTLDISILTNYAPVYDVTWTEVEDGDPIPTDNSQGTSEDTAFKINTVDLIASYKVDTSSSENGTYIYYTLLGSGTYIFELGGSDARIVYNGETYSAENPLILNVEASSPANVIKYNLLLTAVDSEGNVLDGYYYLHIHKYEG